MANVCWGVPDIFVVAEVANADELDKLVIDKIQAIEGVERTETYIAIEFIRSTLPPCGPSRFYDLARSVALVKRSSSFYSCGKWGSASRRRFSQQVLAAHPHESRKVCGHHSLHT